MRLLSVEKDYRNGFVFSKLVGLLAQHFKDLGDSEQTPCDLATLVDYTHLTAMRAPRWRRWRQPKSITQRWGGSVKSRMR